MWAIISAMNGTEVTKLLNGGNGRDFPSLAEVMLETIYARSPYPVRDGKYKKSQKYESEIKLK